MIQEEWRPIYGLEDDYMVSNYGNVKRIYEDGQYYPMSPIKMSNGYLAVHIRDKMMLIHRLVAEAFIFNPYQLPEVNHKDENKLNNSLENLEFCTRRYNVNYGNRIKNFVKSKCRAVRCINSDGEVVKMYPAIKYVSLDGYVRYSVIKACKFGRKYKGYTWEYC